MLHSAPLPLQRRSVQRSDALWIATLVAVALLLVGPQAWRFFHRSPSAALSDVRVRGFADEMSRRLGRNAVVYGRTDILPLLDGHVTARLAYRGMPDSLATDTQWTILERGAPADVEATLRQLEITNVLIQTAQPRPHVFDSCVRGTPAIRSEVFEVSAQSSYALEVYAIDACRTAAAPAPPTIDPKAEAFADAVVTAIGRDAVVYARADTLPIFEGKMTVRLVSRGTGPDALTEAQTATLEIGTADAVQSLVTAKRIRYVLIQTAQPRPNILQLCVHTPALVRSELYPIEGGGHYAFEIHAVGGCRAARGRGSR